jgi:hypothetical protein
MILARNDPMKSIERLCTFALAAAGLLPGVARAQFPGDLLFEDPSVISVGGASVTLTVGGFYGPTPVGAVLFDLFYDPTLVEIGTIALDGDVVGTVYRRDVAEDQVAVALFNDGSSSAPAGSVSLVSIEVLPLGSPGSTAFLSAIPRQSLATAGTPFGSNAGGSAQVTVVAATAAVAAGPAPEGSSELLLERTPLRPLPWQPWGAPPPLAPAGALVPEWVRAERGSAPYYLRAVRLTFDPSAPSELR